THQRMHTISADQDIGAVYAAVGQRELNSIVVLSHGGEPATEPKQVGGYDRLDSSQKFCTVQNVGVFAVQFGTTRVEVFDRQHGSIRPAAEFPSGFQPNCLFLHLVQRADATK